MTLKNVESFRCQGDPVTGKPLPVGFDEDGGGKRIPKGNYRGDFEYQDEDWHISFMVDDGPYNAETARVWPDMIKLLKEAYPDAHNSNVFDVDWESDDLVWNFDITGDSNNINTLQKDGEQELNFELTGDSADVDINQISGTCVSGAGNSCATPNAHITLDITSDNSVIQINQKDSSNDS